MQQAAQGGNQYTAQNFYTAPAPAQGVVPMGGLSVADANRRRLQFTGYDAQPQANIQAAQGGNPYAAQNAYGEPAPTQGMIPIEEVLFADSNRRRQQSAASDAQTKTNILNAAIGQTLYNQQNRAGAPPGPAGGTHFPGNPNDGRREGASASTRSTARPPAVVDNRDRYSTAGNTQMRANTSNATFHQVSGAQQSSATNHHGRGSGNNSSSSRGLSSANPTSYPISGNQQTARNRPGEGSGNNSSSSRGRGRGRGGGEAGGGNPRHGHST